MATLRDWLNGARPRTLPAAVVPVLVGTAAAVGDNPHGIVGWRAGAALLTALGVQIGTNYANDYNDGKRGTDDPQRRVGPVRLVGWKLAKPKAVKAAAIAAFAVAGGSGLVLSAAVSWWLVPVGAAAILAGWFYTGGPRPYGYAGYGELFVFVFFGLVATVGTAFVQSEKITLLALGAAVPVGLLSTAMLVVNNLRDIPGDREVGKKTLAVRLGDGRTRWLYVSLVTGALASVPLVAGRGGRPMGGSALASVLLARRPVVAVLSGAKGRDLVPVLVDTGRVQMLFGALFAAGLAYVPS